MGKGNSLYYGGSLQFLNAGKYQGYKLDRRYNCGFGGSSLPQRPQKESPFSDLGLFLLGLIFTTEEIKMAERMVK